MVDEKRKKGKYDYDYDYEYVYECAWNACRLYLLN